MLIVRAAQRILEIQPDRWRSDSRDRKQLPGTLDPLQGMGAAVFHRDVGANDKVSDRSRGEDLTRPAAAITRAARCTAIPPTSPSRSLPSPVCSPAPICSPIPRSSSLSAATQRISRRGHRRAIEGDQIRRTAGISRTPPFAQRHGKHIDGKVTKRGLLSAASNTRSLAQAGHDCWRRSTASSWRNTSISSSLPLPTAQHGQLQAVAQRQVDDDQTTPDLRQRRRAERRRIVALRQAGPAGHRPDRLLAPRGPQVP